MQEYAVIIQHSDWELLGQALEQLYQVEALLEAVESRLGQASDEQTVLWLSRALTKLVGAREKLESVLGL